MSILTLVLLTCTEADRVRGNFLICLFIGVWSHSGEDSCGEDCCGEHDGDSDRDGFEQEQVAGCPGEHGQECGCAAWRMDGVGDHHGEDGQGDGDCGCVPAVSDEVYAGDADGGGDEMASYEVSGLCQRGGARTVEQDCASPEGGDEEGLLCQVCKQGYASDSKEDSHDCHDALAPVGFFEYQVQQFCHFFS